jgi:hypothetical protein
MTLYFKYDEGNAFTLDGVDYVGFFHVINGVAYSGKSPSVDSMELTSKGTYLAELFLSQAKFDGRRLELDLELPDALDVLDDTTIVRYFEKISKNNSIIFNSNVFINPTVAKLNSANSVFYTLTSYPAIDGRPSDGIVYGKNTYTHSEMFSANPDWTFLDYTNSGYITLPEGENGFIYVCMDGENQYSLSGVFTPGDKLKVLNVLPIGEAASTIPDYDTNEVIELTKNSIQIYDVSNYYACNTKVLKDSIQTIVDLNFKQLYKIGKTKRTEFKNNTLYIKNKYSNELYASYPLIALDLDNIIALDIRKEDDSIIAIGTKLEKYIFLTFDVDNFNQSFGKTELAGISKVVNLQFSQEDSDIFEIWQEGYKGQFNSQKRSLDRPNVLLSNASSDTTYKSLYIQDYLFNTTEEKFDQIQIKFNSNRMKSNSYNLITQNSFQRNNFFYEVTHAYGRIFATKTRRSFYINTIPLNLAKTYKSYECSDSGAGLSFNASLINLIRDTLNLAALSQKTKGQVSDPVNILNLAEPIEKLTIDMENLRLNGNETFSEIAIRRIFQTIYSIQSKIYKVSNLSPERPNGFVTVCNNFPTPIQPSIESIQLPQVITAPVAGTSSYDECLPDQLYVSFGSTGIYQSGTVFTPLIDGTFVATFDGNGYLIHSGNGLWINKYNMFEGEDVIVRLEYVNGKWIIKVNDELWMNSYYIEDKKNGIEKCNPFCKFASIDDISNLNNALIRPEIQTSPITTDIAVEFLNVQPVPTIPAIGPESVKVLISLPNQDPVKICARYYDRYSGYLLYAKDNKGVDPATRTEFLTFPLSFLVLRFVNDSWIIEENLDNVQPPLEYYENGALKIDNFNIDTSGVTQAELANYRTELFNIESVDNSVYDDAPDEVKNYLKQQQFEIDKIKALQSAESEAFAKWLPDKSPQFNKYNNQTTPYNLQFIKYRTNPAVISTYLADDECKQLNNILI